MRGEHKVIIMCFEYVEGSSPHARGTHAAFEKAIAATGIIPACAGNTSTCTSRGVMRGDHPRMRGEHYGDSDFVDELEGSSPHARGTPGHGRLRYDGDGIIPACAGNTVSGSAMAKTMRDHPRMRGEHLLWCVTVCGGLGSSPHARGTRWGCEGVGCVGGIIPACAGNTVRSAAWRRPARDHPRMRGEHLATAWIMRAQRGSSPHARGTLRRAT